MLDKIQDKPTLDYIVSIARRSAITAVTEYHAKLRQNVVRCSVLYPGYESEISFYVIIGSDGHYVRILGEIDLGVLGQLRLANDWNNSIKLIGPAIPMSDGYVLTYCVTFGQGMVGMNFAQTLLLFCKEMAEFRAYAIERHAGQADRLAPS